MSGWKTAAGLRWTQRFIAASVINKMAPDNVVVDVVVAADLSSMFSPVSGATVTEWPFYISLGQGRRCPLRTLLKSYYIFFQGGGGF